MRFVLALGMFLASLGPTAAAAERRQVISLDGTWQIAEGLRDRMPSRFDHQIPVPGLADMARPPFENVGNDRSHQYRQAFWYRRRFDVAAPYPEVVRLKLHKAMYGTRVFLNGKLVGEHLPCFTPVEFDIRRFLRPPEQNQNNELVIAVGGHRNELPPGIPDGWDLEKFDYPPGIYDSVELILSGTPHVANVQAVPDLEKRAVRVVAEIEGGCAGGGQVSWQVREVRTHKLVGSIQSPCPAGAKNMFVDLRIAIEGCRFWSPEDPFLYELEVATPGDVLRTRFGMRTFRLDPTTGRAILNGKPYFLRGTTMCILRLFEDARRGNLPWREDWVRQLHRVFRGMHWNTLRYCIGFPPEKWYQIADEEGLLIQDEFPVWYAGYWPSHLKSAELAQEYTEWMRERWNHPCVVIWDGQNETVTTETGKAIRAVRHLDLSGRPWDNGWSPPQDPADCVEAHPYAFGWDTFRFSDFGGMPGTIGSPGGMPNVFPNVPQHAIIINEYGWGQLDREGNVTVPQYFAKYYEIPLGPNTTAEQRREYRARTLAAETEFWRAHRHMAGVLHFCGLAYSKPKAVTSDHFVDIEKLILEPPFKKYVGDAFAPVGLMVDFWGGDLPAGRKRPISVVVINDLYSIWQGTVHLRAVRDSKTMFEDTQTCAILPLGSRTLQFRPTVPSEAGKYQWVAELIDAERKQVQSLRDFTVVPAHEWREEIARGKPVTASSSVGEGDPAYSATAAVDGNVWTRWLSAASDPQWIAVDLGQPEKVCRVDLIWEAHALQYSIQVSLDGRQWKDVFTTETGPGGRETIAFAPTEARFVRMLGRRRANPAAGYALLEFRVFR
jgi:hypothetical protein